MPNLINDLYETTHVSEKYLEKLLDATQLCLGHALYEELDKGRTDVELDIGIGILELHVTTESIKYRFIPTGEFERILARVVTTGQSPVAERLEVNLQKRIEQTYEGLL